MVNKFKPKKIHSAVIFFSKNIFALTFKSNVDIISRLTRESNINVLKQHFAFNSM